MGKRSLSFFLRSLMHQPCQHVLPICCVSGATCTFRPLVTSQPAAEEEPIWQLANIVVHTFSALDTHTSLSAPGDSSVAMEPESTTLSATAEASLIKEAIMSALAAMKQATHGQFGKSKIEAHLDVCLPSVCSSCTSIIRYAGTYMHIKPAAVPLQASVALRPSPDTTHCLVCVQAQACHQPTLDAGLPTAPVQHSRAE